MLWLECGWEPHTAFGSPVLGCTLFSRLVAELARRHPAGVLNGWLAGYGAGRPFLVVGDPRPQGHVPRPALAPHEFAKVVGVEPKALKSRRWVPERILEKPATLWLESAVRDADLLALHSDETGAQGEVLLLADDRTGFSVSAGRLTHWPLFHYAPLPWVVDVLVDTDRIAPEIVLAALRHVGATGQGAHAARGLGKFSVRAAKPKRWRHTSGGVAYCLGACAPPGVPTSQGYEFARYRTRIIRGWSGASNGHERVEHAKLPFLVAEAGALFSAPAGNSSNVFGRGLGGVNEPLSKVDPRAVAQGYAPALWVALHPDPPPAPPGSAAR